MRTSTNGYSKLSITLHWLAAIGIIALFFTHEGDRGSAQQIFHVSGGAIIGVFLIWRVLRRPIKGFAQKPDQPNILNIISKLVLWALLAAILVVTLTGYLLPWSIGRTIEIFGLLQIPSPMSASRDLHEIFEELHDTAGHALIPLTGLHILGALKHFFIDKDQIMQRMFKSKSDGN